MLSGHLVSRLPAEAHVLPCHIPSDSCHRQVLHRWMHPSTIPTSCSYFSLLPQSCPHAPAPFLSIVTTPLGQSFRWSMEKHCIRSCARTPSTQHRSLENAATKHQAHCSDTSPTEETLLKSYLVPNRFSQPEHNNNNQNHFSKISRLFWKT